MAPPAKPPRKAPPLPAGAFRLPLLYRVFFLFIEPISALVGAYYSYFNQHVYLTLTDASSAPEKIPRASSVALSQLSNLYLLFALNEALVLRSTTDLRVWRTVLSVLLVADLGHLCTVAPLGWDKYWDLAGWNAIDWGNVPFVYAGAAMRVAFLSGVGLAMPTTAAAGGRGTTTTTKTRSV